MTVRELRKELNKYLEAHGNENVKIKDKTGMLHDIYEVAPDQEEIDNTYTDVYKGETYSDISYDDICTIVI